MPKGIYNRSNTKLPCPECPRTFNHAAGLSSHLRNAHGMHIPTGKQVGRPRKHQLPFDLPKPAHQELPGELGDIQSNSFKLHDLRTQREELTRLLAETQNQLDEVSRQIDEVSEALSDAVNGLIANPVQQAV